MTIAEILNEMKPVKPVSRARLYVYIDRFKIKPVSRVKQKPQHYPADTPQKILAKLGLVTTKRNGHSKRRAQ